MIDRALAMLLSLATATAVAADRPVRVAFPGVEVQDARAKGAADVVTAAIAAEITASGRALVTAAELSAGGVEVHVLRSCPSAACQALAPKVDADYVLLVSVARLGRRLGAELRLVDPPVLAPLAERAEVATSEKELATVASAAARELLGLVPQRKAVAEPVVLAPVEPGPTAPPPPPAVHAERPSRWPGVLVASAGGAAAIGGTVLVVTALGFNQSKAELTFDDAEAARASAQARLTAGYALIGAGAAAVGVGLWKALSPGPVSAAFFPAPGGGTLAIAGAF